MAKFDVFFFLSKFSASASVLDKISLGKTDPKEIVQQIVPSILRNDVLQYFSEKLAEGFEAEMDITLFENDLILERDLKTNHPKLLEAFLMQTGKFMTEYLNSLGLKIPFETLGMAEFTTSGLTWNDVAKMLELPEGIIEVVLGDHGLEGGDPIRRFLKENSKFALLWSDIALCFWTTSRIKKDGDSSKGTECDQPRITSFEKNAVIKKLIQLTEILDLHDARATQSGDDAIAEGSLVGEINIHDNDPYVHKHNHEWIQKLLRGFSEITAGTENRMQYYLGNILAKNPQDRFLIRFGPLVSVNELQLYNQLQNPALMSEAKFVAKYGTGSDSYSYDNYKKEIADYRQWVKDNYHDQNAFNEGLQDIFARYMGCFRETQNAFDIASRLYMQELLLSLQANLGINPDSPRDVTWHRTIEYYMPSDFEIEQKWNRVWRKGIELSVFSPKPGSILRRETITIDRRLIMVANNPEIDISKLGELTDQQKEIINRLKFQLVYTQNRLLLEYRAELDITDQWNNWNLWEYTGNIYGKDYHSDPLIIEEKDLPDGFALITIEEINQAFPTT